ncbi:ash family protein [Candidatus Symbiopectobacterium sp. NZEC135]|nr:ash family protein [Candidatus Symbiopectobacterium sp. NZEC135]
MVDRAGASQDAPVSMRPVRSTPSGSTTREIDLSGGGNKYYSSEAALWLQPSPRHTHYLPFPLALPRISLRFHNTVNASRIRSLKATIPR